MRKSPSPDWTPLSKGEVLLRPVWHIQVIWLRIRFMLVVRMAHSTPKLLPRAEMTFAMVFREITSSP